jgi:hypothetical protein
MLLPPPHNMSYPNAPLHKISVLLLRAVLLFRASPSFINDLPTSLVSILVHQPTPYIHTTQAMNTISQHQLLIEQCSAAPAGSIVQNMSN